jgi:nucleotide-binding universal stress UspA family protein
MINLKRILVAVDFSQCSRHALEYGCALAERFEAELHLLHVASDFDAGMVVPGLGFPPPEVFRREVLEKAQAALAELPAAAWCAGKTVVRDVRYGSPFVEIVRYAKEKATDLIVVGTHGRSGLTHVLLGSVAEKVVRKSPCPVLTVRPEGHQFVMP